MRSHLLSCLEEEEFTLFPRSHKHTKLSKGHIIYVDIYCICRSPFYGEDSERDENLFMAECVKCSDRYHKICLRIPSRVLSIKVSSGNVWDVRRYYWDWKRNKKDFVFVQLKLVWPNDKDARYVYQLLSFFFQMMNL